MEEKLEGTEERSLSANTMCLICCENPSLPQRSFRSTTTGFKSFFKDLLDVTEDKNRKVEVDLCLSCRSLLIPAVEVHEKVMETEARVGELQREILKEMKNLQGQLGQFYVEMEKVREAIEKFPRDKAEASVKLRQKLFGVVRDVQLFNAEFSPKIMLCKIKPSSDGHHHDSMEAKDLEELEEGTQQLETFEDLEMEAETKSNDFGVSIDKHSDNGIEKLNETKPGTENNTDNQQRRSKRARTESCDQQQKQGDLSDPNDSHQEDLTVPVPDDDDDDDPDETGGDNHISEEDDDGSEVESEDEIRRNNGNRKRIRQRKLLRYRPPPPKISVTKGMRPFKKSVVSRIISSEGVTTVLRSSSSKPTIAIEPFRQYPMKFDSKTDTFSVGEIQIILDENGKSLECSRCSMRFTNKGINKPTAEVQVHEHILGEHFHCLKCPICNKAMTTFGGLNKHMRFHQEEGFCDICGRHFADKRKIVRHKITHMNASERAEATARGEAETFESYLIMSKKEQNCSDEVISTLKEIIAKDNTSDWKRKIICRIVKTNAKQTDTDKDSPTIKFPIVYDLATDKLSVSGIEIFMNETEVCLECSSCSAKFHGHKVTHRVELYMHNHILSKHLDAFCCPFPAEQCTSRVRSFDTIFKYNQHLKHYHSKEAQVKAVCEICGKTLKSVQGMISHRAFHAKEKVGKPKTARRLNLPLKHKCSTCGKGFWSRNQYNRHVVSHLPPEQRSSFICNRCGRKFHTIYHLNRHQKDTCLEKGQELPRVPCQFCSRTSKNKELLRKHIAKIHPEHNLEDERPFQCSMCPQRFKTEWSMEAHERIKHSEAEGGVDSGNGNHDGYSCRKGCGKLMANVQGRNVHESYCDGEGSKTERERSKSKK